MNRESYNRIAAEWDRARSDFYGREQAYLDAVLEGGLKPDDTIVDEPVTVEGWSPRNDDRRFRGTVTLRQAFAYSINTVAAKLGLQFGFDTIADMARRFGISTPRTSVRRIAAQTPSGSRFRRFATA